MKSPDNPVSAVTSKAVAKRPAEQFVNQPRGSIRTGGRTERVRLLVASAVLDALRNGNYFFDIKDIADLTGVNKSTIYRRWPTREVLIGEAMKEHNSQIQIVDTGKWRSDLLCLGLNLRSFFSNPTELAFNATLAMSNDPDRSAMADQNWAPVQERLEQVVERAKARGEIPQDTPGRLIMSMLMSPILSQILLGKSLPTDEMIARLVDLLVKATAHPD